MNPREKILAISAFAVTGLLLVVFILTKVILGPTKEARALAQKVEIDVEKYKAKNSMEPVYVDTLLDLTKRSYGDEASTASEMSRAHLMKLIAKSGLAGEDLSMTPVTGKQLKGGKEVGWIIRVKGSQEKLTNLLYVVTKDEHLHKLDNIAWTPIAGSTDLSLQARFVTLVLDPVEGVKPPVINPDAFANNVNVNSPERRWYSLISDRDIFRPYIKRPPPVVVARPPVQPTRPQDPPSTPPPVTPQSSPLQLVGLPTWGGDAEVVIKNTRDGKATAYKIGESLIGGEIIMVDYRPLPLLKKPEFISTSRVIVQVGREYYAIELGQYVTDKYVVTTDRLPEELRGRALPPATTGPSPSRPGSTQPSRFVPRTSTPGTTTPATKAGATETDASKTDASKTDATKTDATKTDATKTAATQAAPIDSGKKDAAPAEPAGTDVKTNEKAPQDSGKTDAGKSTTTSDSTDTSGPIAPANKPVLQEAGQ